MEEIELGCDVDRNCLYYISDLGAFYAKDANGEELSQRDMIALAKNLGYKVEVKGKQIRIRGG